MHVSRAACCAVSDSKPSCSYSGIVCSLLQLSAVVLLCCCILANDAFFVFSVNKMDNEYAVNGQL